jgi:UPF0755 protein
MKDYTIGEKKRDLNKLWRVLSIVVVVILVVTTVFIRQVYNTALQPVSASQHNVLVTVPTGATIEEIAKRLEDAGLIKHAWAFEWYVRNNNIRDKLQAGTYYLRPNQGVKSVVEALTQGKIAANLFTILPGQRLSQIATALEVNGGFKAADVEKALSPDNYADHPALTDKPAGASLEGYLYPESFQKIAETKPETIIRQSLDEMQKHLTPDIREAFVRQGLTVHQGVTLASIVEREVSKPEDRKIVAQVFLSRLKLGMMLQSDVTVIYGALKAGQEPRLDFDSDYNTYKHTGLPPGPISNVSANTLEAVAAPADTDYLYFVAGDDGKTYFSHTVAEHDKLVAEHCKRLCSE